MKLVSHTQIFCVKHITAFLHLGTLDSTPHYACSHFKQQSHQQKAQKSEKCGPKQTMKRTLIYSMRAKQKGRAWPCSATAGNVQVRQLRFFSALLHMATNDSQSFLSIDFGVRNTRQQVGIFANIESMNNEDQLYFLIISALDLYCCNFFKVEAHSKLPES